MIEILLGLLGVGFLIFIHELGHFLAARRVGIHVETFALGFQPTIFGWKARILAFKRGDTEYVIGLIPFGGYVKMAGEEIGDEKTGSQNEFASKSVGERSQVLLAGPLMNILAGFLFFMLAYSVGVQFQSTEVGAVAFDSPAWQAGLRPGDRIKSINGKPQTEFAEVGTTVALASLEEPLTISWERGEGDDVRSLTADIIPRFEPSQGLPSIGIQPGQEMVLRRILPDSPAERAGLRLGDRIDSFTLVGDTGRLDLPPGTPPNHAIDLLATFPLHHPKGRIELSVTRESGESARLTVQLAPPQDASQARPRTGIVERRRTIVGLLPGSEAAKTFQTGSEITLLAEEPVGVLDAWSVAKAAGDRATISFETATGQTGTVERDDLVRWLGSQIQVATAYNTVESVAPESPAASLGIQPGDRLVEFAGRPFTNYKGQPQLIYPQGLAGETQVAWLSSGGVQRGALSGARDKDFGVRFSTRVVVGYVPPGSPAQKAGVRAGDRILRVGDRAIGSWGELVDAATRSEENPPPPLAFEVEREGESVSLEVQPEVYLGSLGVAFGFDTFVQTAPLGAACVLGINKTVLWAKRIFMTLRSLAKREVSARNLAGPIRIIAISSMVLEQGFGKFIYILALISVNLGVLNLLPFPILDGGHLMFLAIEKIKGSPVSESFQYAAHLVAFFLIISVALFVTYHDLRWVLGF